MTDGRCSLGAYEFYAWWDALFAPPGCRHLWFAWPLPADAWACDTWSFGLKALEILLFFNFLFLAAVVSQVGCRLISLRTEAWPMHRAEPHVMSSARSCPAVRLRCCLLGLVDFLQRLLGRYGHGPACWPSDPRSPGSWLPPSSWRFCLGMRCRQPLPLHFIDIMRHISCLSTHWISFASEVVACCHSSLGCSSLLGYWSTSVSSSSGSSAFIALCL